MGEAEITCGSDIGSPLTHILPRTRAIVKLANLLFTNCGASHCRLAYTIYVTSSGLANPLRVA